MEDLVLISIPEIKIRQIIRQELERFNQEIQDQEFPELLTRAQAAQAMGCSSQTVDNYTKIGILTKVILGPRKVRFKRAEILKLSKR